MKKSGGREGESGVGTKGREGGRERRKDRKERATQIVQGGGLEGFGRGGEATKK